MRISLALCWLSALASSAAVHAVEVDKCPPLASDAVPRTVITNGQVSAMVLLPDAQNGFYRGTRFDWSGVVWCLSYKGHSYFGEWYAQNQLRNRITGPVEEFRAADGRSSPGYDAAKPGEPFVKPGVGVLQRVDDKPYSFNADYPVLDSGKWSVKSRKDRVLFRHDLVSPIGMAYQYEKTLRLERNAPVLVLEHALKNTGKQPIDIQVYNHDFFILDETPPGPDVRISFAFKPVAVRALNGARIEGNSILFDAAGGASSEITGYSDKASDFHFFIENTKTGAGVEQIGDVPLAKLDFWSNQKVACPEAYVHIVVPPGKTGRWSIRYRFYELMR